MIPRFQVRNHILTALRTIRPPSYTAEVVTVELRTRMQRDLLPSQCPAISVSRGTDRFARETFGGATNNKNYRHLSLELMLRLPSDSGDEERFEQFAADVELCLLSNRFDATATLPHDIRIDEIQSEEFELAESGIAQARMLITAEYMFRISDL